METVFPRLYLYCKQRGYDFRMVDLRWGVGDPVSDRHDTAELHVEALAQCQETLGPNFIVRYLSSLICFYSNNFSLPFLSFFSLISYPTYRPTRLRTFCQSLAELLDSRSY